MLTGSVPFLYESIIQIMSAHIGEPPVPPRQLRPELSLRVEAVLLRALAKDPAQRFADMLAFRLALEGKRESEPRPEPLAVAAAAAAEEVRLPSEPPQQPLAADETARKRTGNRLAQIVVDRIHKDKLVLPAMPSAARECLSLLDSPVNSLDKVSKVIARDPIIAPQVMRRARSALLGARGNPVKTIDQAVSRLGARELRGLVLDLSARQLFESKNPAIRKLTKNLWQHSVATGVLARALAKRRKDLDPEVAYLAGLLHDVGKPIAAALLLDAERSLDAPQEAWMGSEAWMSVINECQREVGVALARSWEMSDDVLFAIARSERFAKDNPDSIASVVCFANALAKKAAPYPGQVDTIVNDALLREGQAIYKLDDAMVESLVIDLRNQGAD
jgi:putative nucleotidyltransferase with HDIG domain